MSDIGSPIREWDVIPEPVEMPEPIEVEEEEEVEELEPALVPIAPGVEE